MERIGRFFLAWYPAVAALLVLACSRRSQLSASPDASTAPPALSGSSAVPIASTPGPIRAAAELKCASDGWLTYAHDAQRTSASGGCCSGPLKELWTFSPEKHRGVVPEISHAIADDRFIYAVGTIGKSPAAWKVDWSGKELWRFDSRVDIQRGHWPTLGLGSLLVYDDGLYLLDPETGKNRKRRYLDAWGQSLTDGTRFYLVNTWYVDGPQVRIAALDAEGNELWQQFRRGRTREDVMDGTGAIAFDNGTLFYGADYKFGQPGSMIAALEPGTGDTKWMKPAHPASAMSMACGKTFGIEKTGGKRQVVARSQADGEIAWSAPVEASSSQPPGLASSTVLVESGSGIIAFECNTGRVQWSVEAGPRSASSTPLATSLIVASGSRTVVLTRGRELQVLRISDGSSVWKSGPVATQDELHSPVLVGNRLLVMEGKRLVAFGE